VSTSAIETGLVTVEQIERSLAGAHIEPAASPPPK
jgi:hypothetical protein